MTTAYVTFVYKLNVILMYGLQPIDILYSVAESASKQVTLELGSVKLTLKL